MHKRTRGQREQASQIRMPTTVRRVRHTFCRPKSIFIHSISSAIDIKSIRTHKARRLSQPKYGRRLHVRMDEVRQGVSDARSTLLLRVAALRTCTAFGSRGTGRPLGSSEHTRRTDGVITGGAKQSSMSNNKTW